MAATGGTTMIHARKHSGSRRLPTTGAAHCRSLVAFIAASAGFAEGLASQSATVKLPVFDQRIDHPEPENGSGDDPTFGWSMAVGRAGNPASDDKDDVIIASFFKDSGADQDVGRVYPYEGPALDHYPD